MLACPGFTLAELFDAVAPYLVKGGLLGLAISVAGLVAVTILVRSTRRT
jgi:hypothetical protein